MIAGLKQFAAHFAGYKDRYVLIGGTALWLAMDDAGLQTRATKDLDIVLCVESLDVEFVEVFWKFIRVGKYQVQERSTGERIFFRFQKPETEGFPAMLELFSRTPETVVLDAGAHLTPIPLGDEVSSLSAILLDDDYYQYLHAHTRELQGVSIVDETGLLLLKARAWLDLVARKQAGEKIDSKAINKHRNDILRIYQLLEPALRVAVPANIAADIAAFLEMAEPGIDAALLKHLGLQGMDSAEICAAIRAIFGIETAPANA